MLAPLGTYYSIHYTALFGRRDSHWLRRKDLLSLEQVGAGAGYKLMDGVTFEFAWFWVDSGIRPGMMME